jgi:hypothetical protein
VAKVLRSPKPAGLIFSASVTGKVFFLLTVSELANLVP